MRIAMAGAGGFADAHLGYLTGRDDIEVVGHLSRREESRVLAARRWGGRAYGGIDELLDNERPDALWITVPPNAHGSIEQACIERGVPFFVEKPLSADRETAARIGGALQSSGLLAAVGYHWRAMDTMPAVREAIAGRPPRMVLAAWHGATPPPAWWRRQEASGGQMVEQATHLFDIARHLVGEARVIGASAERLDRPAYPNLDVATTSSAVLEFEGGAKGIVTATCLLEGSAEVYVKLVCEGMLITITREGVTFDEGREVRHLRLQEQPLAREDAAFIEALETGDGSHLFCSYEDALRTHHLCFDVLDMTTGGATRK